MRALRLERAPVNQHARRTVGLADAEWDNACIGEATFLFQCRRVTDGGDGLTLDFADAGCRR